MPFIYLIIWGGEGIGNADHSLSLVASALVIFFSFDT